MSEAIHDVAIIGYGPVGQALAGLLGSRGVEVIVVERFDRPFGLPRAVRFDHEAMRLWQELGFADALIDDLLPVSRYDWYGADGELMVSFTTPDHGPSGWRFAYSFFQPALEESLDRTVTALPSVQVRRGVTMIGLTLGDDHVELDLRPSHEPDRSSAADSGVKVRARYVVGADGARSTVRDALGVSFEDLGFSERWFVVDVRPEAEALSRFGQFPTQRCQPARPYVMTAAGRRHRRWEFMLLPGEDADDFAGPERTWEFLEPWLAPREATVIRQAVYEFGSKVASTMRVGRCFLAGDAAHLMPPHMGEGMCSGVRDASNLAWKLQLALQGRADDRLLESYTTERRPHAAALVEQSRRMGQVSCELDPVAASARDAQLRASGGVAPWPFPSLGPGCLYEGPDGVTELAGTLAVQGNVEAEGRVGRFDDVVGRGFVVISAAEPPDELLADGQLTALERLGAQLVALGDGPGRVRDIDGQLTAWLESHGAAAVVVRPDYYVYGAVAATSDLTGLVNDLLERTALVPQAQCN